MPIPRVDIGCCFAGRHTLFFSFAIGGLGVLPVLVMREADRFSGTATCDAGVTRIPAVFGLPFSADTWNSFA